MTPIFSSIRRRLWLFVSTCVLVVCCIMYYSASLSGRPIFSDSFVVERFGDCQSVSRLNAGKTDFIQTQEGGFYIFDAAASRRFHSNRQDIVVISGWMPARSAMKWFKCCFMLGDSMVVSVDAIRRHPGNTKSHLLATQFDCSNPLYELKKEPQYILVSLVAKDFTCPTNSTLYRKVDVSRKLDNAPQYTKVFAVCGKVVHGTKPASVLVEWIEYQRHFGVDKILVYKADNLNAQAQRVLDYYSETGFVEVRCFGKVPENDSIPRHLWGGGYYKWNDDLVVLYDAVERLSEYKYATLVDIDEYLYPTGNNVTSYTAMMERLLRRWPQSVGFSFLDHVYTKTWGKTNPAGDMEMTQFTNRTVAMMDLPKHVYVTERLLPGAAGIHTIRAGNKFTGPYRASETEAVMKHYRTCQDSWINDKSVKPNKCLGIQRYKDSSMVEVARQIRPSVDKVKSLLGLTT